MANSNSVPNVASTRMQRNFSTRHSSEELAEFALAAKDEFGDQLLLLNKQFNKPSQSHPFSVQYVVHEWYCVAGGTESSMAAQDFPNVEEQENTDKGAQLHITAVTTTLPLLMSIIVVAQRFCSRIGFLCLPTLVVCSSQTQRSQKRVQVCSPAEIS